VPLSPVASLASRQKVEQKGRNLDLSNLHYTSGRFLRRTPAVNQQKDFGEVYYTYSLPGLSIKY